MSLLLWQCSQTWNIPQFLQQYPQQGTLLRPRNSCAVVCFRRSVSGARMYARTGVEWRWFVTPKSETFRLVCRCICVHVYVCAPTSEIRLAILLLQAADKQTERERERERGDILSHVLNTCPGIVSGLFKRPPQAVIFRS